MTEVQNTTTEITENPGMIKTYSFDTTKTTINETTLEIMKRLSNDQNIKSASNDMKKRIFLAVTIKETIRHQTINTGNITTLDVIDLIEQDVFQLEEALTIVQKVFAELEEEKELVTAKESRYVYKFQCKNKIEKIQSLNKIQKLVYELYPIEPNIAKLGMNKMTEEERITMKEVLAYQR